MLGTLRSRVVRCQVSGVVKFKILMNVYLQYKLY